MDLLATIFGYLGKHLQLGLDLATAASVIGASIYYVRNSIKEKKKDRDAKKKQLIIEKTSHLVSLLGEKSMEANDIVSENKYLFTPDDYQIIYLARQDDPLDGIPKVISIKNYIYELENRIFRPLINSLQFCPYRKFLSEEIQKEIQLFIDTISKYVTIDEVGIILRPTKEQTRKADEMCANRTPSIVEDIIAVECIASFPYFLQDKGVIEEIYEDPLLGTSNRDTAMEAFNKLDTLKKFDLKFEFLKQYKTEIAPYEETFDEIPSIIAKSAHSLIEKISDL